MNLYYYKDTDLLYIDLSEKTSVEAQEVSTGVVFDFFDFDDAGQVCGIEIDSMEPYLLSESALAKDWLGPEEDAAWKDL